VAANAMTSSESPFMTAEWRHLVLLNFEVDPGILRSLVPSGTELDTWQNRTFVSVVGFLFLNTRVLGVAIPCHQNFEEVNLRFYVRRRVHDEWRRAVVFVKEIVPRAAIALTARTLYGENYVALPMSHRVNREMDNAAGLQTISYSWLFRGRENRLELSVAKDNTDVAQRGDVEFITEHYWGYARRRDGDTNEYRVEHPRWRVYDGTAALLDCDVAGLYGSQFVEFLRTPPASAFLADGSKVTVFKGTPLRSRPYF